MPNFAFFHKRVWRTSKKKFKKIKNFEWENCQIFADFIWNDSLFNNNTSVMDDRQIDEPRQRANL